MSNKMNEPINADLNLIQAIVNQKSELIFDLDSDDDEKLRQAIEALVNDAKQLRYEAERFDHENKISYQEFEDLVNQRNQLDELHNKLYNLKEARQHLIDYSTFNEFNWLYFSLQRAYEASTDPKLQWDFIMLFGHETDEGIDYHRYYLSRPE